MSDTATGQDKKDTPRGAPDKFNGLTQRDLEILSHAWGAMRAQPEIDYQKLADSCGMTNPRSASNAWSAIKKKLFANVPAPAKATDASPGTPGKKRKAPAAKKPTAKNEGAAATAAVKDEDGVEDGDELQAEASPVKKARSRAKPKPKTPAKVKHEDAVSDADENEEDAEKPKPKPKAAAKPKTTPKAKKDAAANAKDLEPKAEEEDDDEDGPDGADSVPAGGAADEGSVDGEV